MNYIYTRLDKLYDKYYFCLVTVSYLTYSGSALFRTFSWICGEDDVSLQQVIVTICGQGTYHFDHSLEITNNKSKVFFQ